MFIQLGVETQGKPSLLQEGKKTKSDYCMASRISRLETATSYMHGVYIICSIELWLSNECTVKGTVSRYKRPLLFLKHQMKAPEMLMPRCIV